MSAASEFDFMEVADSGWSHEDVIVVSSVGEALIFDCITDTDEYPIPLGCKPRPLLPAAFSDESTGRSWMAVDDIDRDGAFDLIVSESRVLETGGTHASIVWYENLGYRFQRHLIAEGATAYGRIATDDVNRDGQLDVISFGDAGILLHEFESPVLVGESKAFGLGVTFSGMKNDFDVTAIATGDMDGDGDTDIVFGDGKLPGLYWQPNIGGGNFGTPVLLRSHVDRINAITITDAQNDNDLDIFYVASNGTTSQYYFMSQNSIQRFEGGKRGQPIEGVGHSAIAADFDNDDDVDLLLGNQWVEYKARQGFVTYHSIRGGRVPFTAVHGDIDQDGDIDLVMSRSRNGQSPEFVVYDNKNSSQQFPEIGSWPQTGKPTALTDLNGDGYPELLWESAGYFPNVDGTLSPNLVMFRDTMAAGANAVGDLDEDGNTDIVFVEANALAVVTIDGLQATTIQIDESDIGVVNGIEIADLDEDGRLDLLIATSDTNGLSWYRNTSNGWSDRKSLIQEEEFHGALDVNFADLDSDGDLDIVSRNVAGQFGWYQTEPETEVDVFRGGILIGDGASELFIWDVDSDGAKDIVVFERSDDGAIYSWYQNIDGQGQFAEPVGLNTPEFLTVPNGRTSAFVSVDVDGDGDEDLVVTRSLSIDFEAGTWFGWIENRGVSEPMIDHQLFWFPALIGIGKTLSLDPVDIDSDGQLEFLMTYRLGLDGFETGVYLYRNEGDEGRLTNFASNQSIRRTVPVDFDDDGDIDVIALTWSAAILFENTDGMGNFVEKATLITARVEAVFDIDGDGDVDFLGQSSQRDVWYENQGNQQDFLVRESEPSLIPENLSEKRTADFDGDGQIDIVGTFTFSNTFYHLQFFRNLLPTRVTRDLTGDGTLDGQDVDALCAALVAGETDKFYDVDENETVDMGDVDALLSQLGSVVADVNFDGLFNSSDLVAIFQMGLYGQGPSASVHWSTGDWNCDGRVDSDDLVVAFQLGHYVRG